MTIVCVKVSGVVFEFHRDILNNDKYRHQTLSKMVIEAEKGRGPLTVIVNRSSECFAAILSYYETEKLHMPLSVCPGHFKDELEYWGLDANLLESCCLYRYFTYIDDMETNRTFKEAKNPSGPTIYTVPATSRLQMVRQKIWRVVDNQEKSIAAKVYVVFLFLLVVVSIAAMAYSTEAYLQRSLTVCEYKEYLRVTGHEYYDIFMKAYGHIDCTFPSNLQDDSPILPPGGDLGYEDDWEGQTDDSDYQTPKASISSTPSAQPSSTNASAPPLRPSQPLPNITAQHYVFDVIDNTVVALFTLEFLIRISTCPSILFYFTSLINFLDTCALLASYVHLAVRLYLIEERYKFDSWTQSLEAVQVIRVLRIFRIVKNVPASRVLSFSLKQNAKDMLLLALFLFLSISFFANVLYFIEDRQTLSSIPEGWYWAAITLTTVGYGDITPKTGLGRFTSCICAITGVLLLAVTLPMFVNNFLTLYHYSSIEEIIERKREALTAQPRRKQSIFQTLFQNRRTSRQINVENKITKERLESSRLPTVCE